MRLMAGLDRPTDGPRPGRRARRHRRRRAPAQRRDGLPAVHQLPVDDRATTTSPRRCAWRASSRRRSTSGCGRRAEMLHIEHLLDRLPAELSGGQQQRTALARALVKGAAAAASRRAAGQSRLQAARGIARRDAADVRPGRSDRRLRHDRADRSADARRQYGGARRRAAAAVRPGTSRSITGRSRCASARSSAIRR